MLQQLMKCFVSQRGAMFGMDARVALIVASVLAGTGGVTWMSRIESNRIDEATRAAEEIKTAIISYYEGNTEAAWNTFQAQSSANIINALRNGGYFLEGVSDTDPWGSAWIINIVYIPRTAGGAVIIEGEQLPVSYITVHSNGKDATGSGTATIANASTYGSWAPAGDDIGLKFNTLSVERSRLLRYRAQGETIIGRLNAVEASNYLEAEADCGGGTPSGWCSSGGGFQSFNYYPKDADDASTAVFYEEEISRPEYDTDIPANMEALVVNIGLPASLTYDPWGRMLRYDANVGDRAVPPFTATICFTSVTPQDCL